MTITIKTPLPGPKAREAMARDGRVISQSYTRDPQAPVVVERAQGVWVTDVDGNTFLDFAAGIAVCATGHCHPQVVAAIESQARKLIHISGTDFFDPAQAALAERLTALVPGDFPKRVFFSNSGAESIEAALKLVRYKTRRQYVIAFTGAFHGRTYGAMSLSASKTVHRTHFGPLVPGIIHVPYPYCYRCPFNLERSSCSLACLGYIQETVFRKLVDPQEVAAVFIEPIQGEGGYIPAPDDFLQGLRQLTAQHGILLVVDEVQSGIGRTGKMFAFEWTGIEPDVICIAKGIASGLPLGITVYRSDERDWGPGAHANTFGGNPLACAAAQATLDLVKDSLLRNVNAVGLYIGQRLFDLAEEYPIIGDVRGRGFMLGAEIVKDRDARTKDKESRDALTKICYEQGLIILGCGENTVRFAPPLIMTSEEARLGLDVFAAAVQQVARRG
jgi:4-aminobutyrate aminotransferase